MTTTSITDTQDFKDACRSAAQNIMAPFKRDPRVIQVLEHVDRETGAAYLDVVESQTPELLTQIAMFARQDQVGKAKVVDYGRRGVVSPNTCRYLKVLSDLLVMFPGLAAKDDLKIVEIGGGYGGQAYVLSSWLNISSYTIIDLAEVGLLQQEYLEHMCPTLPLTLLGHDQFNEFAGADLIISNYALSECRRPIAETYVRRVANSCGNGYLTCNLKDDTCPTRDDLLAWLAPATSVLAEVPSTDPKNYILTWTDR